MFATSLDNKLKEWGEVEGGEGAKEGVRGQGRDERAREGMRGQGRGMRGQGRG